MEIKVEFLLHYLGIVKLNGKMILIRFIFDLNIYKKFKKIKKDNSICCLKNHGPYTYNLGFYQKDQIRKIHHCGIKINKYYESGEEFLLNNNGNDNYFDIKEVEVYKIKI